MGELHYAIVIEFPNLKGIPAFRFDSLVGLCTFTTRQNRHGADYTSPPISHWGELALRDSAPETAATLAIANAVVAARVTGWSSPDDKLTVADRRFEEKDAVAWLLKSDHRTVLRWVDLATFNATGSTNTFPPPMPPALPPIDKSTLTYPERLPAAKMHDLLNSPTEGTDIVTNVSFDSRGRAKIGPSSN